MQTKEGELSRINEKILPYMRSWHKSTLKEVDKSKHQLIDRIKDYEAKQLFRKRSDDIANKRNLIKQFFGCIAAGRFHTVGVQTNGLVVAVGRNRRHGQRNIDGWRKVVAVAAGENHTVGLCLNGTTVATGNNEFGQCDINYTDENKVWRDIIAIAAGANHSLGIKHNGLTLGTMVLACGKNDFGQCDTQDWRYIIDIAAGENHSVGLQLNGKVLAVGNNDRGQLNINSWHDIISVATGAEHTVGLRSDGTVVTAGSNEWGQLDVGSWVDIIAISAGSWHTVGLKKNGTVVAVGGDRYGQLKVKDWSHIVSITAGRVHTVGLKQDGTVVAVGAEGETEEDGRCSVSNWVKIGSLNKNFERLMEEAAKHIGKPYLMGANGPDAFDCSSFVSWVYTRSGVYTLSRQQRRKAADIHKLTENVLPDNKVKGDLVFFRKAGQTTGDDITHVGIYIGKCMMIHAGGEDVNIENINTD